jgi:hypothetical protein
MTDGSHEQSQVVWWLLNQWETVDGQVSSGSEGGRLRPAMSGWLDVLRQELTHPKCEQDKGRGGQTQLLWFGFRGIRLFPQCNLNSDPTHR